MATRKFKFKHIAQDASQHVGDAGELILDTATNTLKVSNGSTAGGVTLNTDGSSSDAEPDFEIKTSDFNVESGKRYAVSTAGNTVTATLPGSPSTGDAVFFADAGGNFGSNNLTIGRNGNTIMALSQDMTISNNNSSTGLLYTGSTWRIF